MVRAKFRVTSLTHTSSNYGGDAGKHEQDEVKLSPVMDEANKSWTKWTPGGEIRMSINNPDALNQFKVGECYFVDFTPAPQKEADELFCKADGAVQQA